MLNLLFLVLLLWIIYSMSRVYFEFIEKRHGFSMSFSFVFSYTIIILVAG